MNLLTWWNRRVLGSTRHKLLEHMAEQSSFQCMTGVHILNSTSKGCQTSKATTTFDSTKMSLVEFTSKRVTCLPNSRWCFWRIQQSFLRPHVFRPKWIQQGWAKIANSIFSVRSGSFASQAQKNWLHQLLRNEFNNGDISTQECLKMAPLGATTSMKVLINSTKLNLTKINSIWYSVKFCQSFYYKEGQNTIVTNCKAFHSNFKLKSLGPIFFAIFCALVSQNYEGQNTIVTNCKSF